MAHVQPSTLRTMAARNLVRGMPSSLPALSAPLTCSACIIGKHSKAPHSRRPHLPAHPGTRIASDTCGTVSPPSLGGFLHFITFLDRSSKFCIVKLIKNRSELATIVPTTLNEIMTHHSRPIQIFLTDNAKEYSSKSLKLYYGKAGIRYFTTVPHTREENAAAERLNRTLFERARASLHASRLPNTFWGAAILDAADKYNKTLHITIMQVFYTLWYGVKLNLSRLLPFGTRGYFAHVTSTKKRKLTTRSHPCRYLGISDDQHYVIYNITLKRTTRCRIANFIQYHPARDPTRIFNCPNISLITMVPQTTVPSTTHAPKSLKHARDYPDAAEWSISYHDELNKLKKYCTFHPVPLTQIPPGTRILPLTTDFKYKRDENNILDKRKVRISLRGDLMEPYKHYDPEKIATYALDKTTARAMFSIAAAQNLLLHHIDIESAFLHERLHPGYPIYVKIPPNFDGSQQYPFPYARLQSNLYGARQAGYTYFHGMKTFLQAHGYTPLASDNCVFIKHYTSGNYVLIGVTIDDFLVAATHKALVDQITKLLRKKYTITDMGPAVHYIGWKITQSATGIHISQPAAIATLLEEFKKQDSTPTPTPYCNGLEFEECRKDEQPLNTKTYPYAHGVGLLRYLADSTRPDITHVTNSLSRYLKCPTMRHWTQFKRVLRYLKGTASHGILYGRRMAPLTSFSDSDFGSCPDTRRSTSGSLHLLNSSPISWDSKRQGTVAL